MRVGCCGAVGLWGCALGQGNECGRGGVRMRTCIEGGGLWRCVQEHATCIINPMTAAP